MAKKQKAPVETPAARCPLEQIFLSRNFHVVQSYLDSLSRANLFSNKFFQFILEKERTGWEELCDADGLPIIESPDGSLKFAVRPTSTFRDLGNFIADEVMLRDDHSSSTASDPVVQKGGDRPSFRVPSFAGLDDDEFILEKLGLGEPFVASWGWCGSEEGPVLELAVTHVRIRSSSPEKIIKIRLWQEHGGHLWVADADDHCFFELKASYPRSAEAEKDLYFKAKDKPDDSSERLYYGGCFRPKVPTPPGLEMQLQNIRGSDFPNLSAFVLESFPSFSRTQVPKQHVAVGYSSACGDQQVCCARVYQHSRPVWATGGGQRRFASLAELFGALDAALAPDRCRGRRAAHERRLARARARRRRAEAARAALPPEARARLVAAAAACCRAGGAGRHFYSAGPSCRQRDLTDCAIPASAAAAAALVGPAFAVGARYVEFEVADRFALLQVGALPPFAHSKEQGRSRLHWVGSAMFRRDWRSMVRAAEFPCPQGLWFRKYSKRKVRFPSFCWCIYNELRGADSPDQRFSEGMLLQQGSVCGAHTVAQVQGTAIHNNSVVELETEEVCIGSRIGILVDVDKDLVAFCLNGRIVKTFQGLNVPFSEGWQIFAKHSVNLVINDGPSPGAFDEPRTRNSSNRILVSILDATPPPLSTIDLNK